jgi:translocation and assembly module TamB
MEIDLSLDGTAGDPGIRGYARIQDGVYENVRSGTFLKDAELEIVANNSRLVVERGRMSDGEGGTISMQGRIDLVPMQDFPFNVELVFEKAALVRQDYATATAGGRLSFSGSLAEAILAGQLEIVSADFQIPKRLPPDVMELEVIELNREGEKPGSPQTLAKPKKHVIKLNVSVLSPGHVFVRGRGLESEWKGNLQITGNSDKPVITGKLSAVRGFFNFMGKRFDLKEGRINFYGAIPSVPSLDVLAEYSAKDMLARLRLSGSLTEPLLEISSEPSLPKDEILSHLLFGRSITDISPVQAIQLAQAVNTLTFGGGFDFLGYARKFLGVDQLEVKQAENGISEENGSQSDIEASAISVGKYVHERVYVTTERGMQDESGKVAVEVEVTPNITVETEVKENAEGGVGVKWKWNY